MTIDLREIKIVDASPSACQIGRPIHPITKLVLPLEVGQAFGLSTGGGVEHGKLQRKVCSLFRNIRKKHPFRRFHTRTIMPGDKIDNDGHGDPVKVITLAIYRVE